MWNTRTWVERLSNMLPVALVVPIAATTHHNPPEKSFTKRVRRVVEVQIALDTMIGKNDRSYKTTTSFVQCNCDFLPCYILFSNSGSHNPYLLGENANLRKSFSVET